MTHPSVARWIPQGPADSCVIGGKQMGWLNCTPTAFAMGLDKSSLNVQRASGCDVRRSTGDTSGGTTLAQCAPFVRSRGVKVDVYAGSEVVSPFWTGLQVQSGRGFVLQGNTAALIGTNKRSTGSGVNHAVWVNHVRGGTTGEPAEAFVFDPAADGRSSGWGKAAQGPQWWPWSLVLQFAAQLRPWGDSDPRKLGPGKFYCAVFVDTEPHVHVRFGGQKTSPFPDNLKGRPGAGIVARRIRPGPGLHYAPIGELKVGQVFTAYQWVNGTEVDGRIRWYGSHNGNQWVAAAGITSEGGS